MCSFIHNSPQPETIRIVTTRSMGEQDVVPCSRMSPSHMKEPGTDPHGHTHEPGQHLLSERSQTQKGNFCVILFIRNVQNRLIHRNRKQFSGCQSCGRGLGWSSQE